MLYMNMCNEMLQSVHGKVVLAQGLPQSNKLSLRQEVYIRDTNVLKIVVMLSCSGC